MEKQENQREKERQNKQEEESKEDIIISFSDLIDHHPFFQQDVPSSSICKLKSLILGNCLEVDQNQNQNQHQTEKINQIKWKYTQHLQGSSSSSSSHDEDEITTTTRCTMEKQGLIESISSFYQKLQSSRSSFSFLDDQQKQQEEDKLRSKLIDE